MLKSNPELLGITDPIQDDDMDQSEVYTKRPETPEKLKEVHEETEIERAIREDLEMLENQGKNKSEYQHQETAEKDNEEPSEKSFSEYNLHSDSKNGNLKDFDLSSVKKKTQQEVEDSPEKSNEKLNTEFNMSPESHKKLEVSPEVPTKDAKSRVEFKPSPKNELTESPKIENDVTNNTAEPSKNDTTHDDVKFVETKQASQLLEYLDTIHEKGNKTGFINRLCQ